LLNAQPLQRLAKAKAARIRLRMVGTFKGTR
jgi:hypothetical protein